jgi:hypothetical protein
MRLTPSAATSGIAAPIIGSEGKSAAGAIIIIIIYIIVISIITIPIIIITAAFTHCISTKVSVLHAISYDWRGILYQSHHT